jgi:ribosome-associated protein
MADDDEIIEATPAGTELAPRVRVPAGAVRFRFVRARGPGGQNVNKVSSACELRLRIDELAPLLTPGALARLTEALGSRLTAAGEIQIVSDERRTQEQNREAVLERLRELLVRAMVEPKRRRKTKPSYGAKMRRLEGKRIRSAIKSNRRGGREE